MTNLEILSSKIREAIPNINLNSTGIESNSPMLNDVLLWLKKQNYMMGGFNNYYFYKTNNSKSNEHLTVFIWVLTSPYLKDQSEELIDFLLEDVAK